ncbi:MAG: M3 family metallopeptidase [Comamonadaceae bacterium]|nr:M3 family metallopeptidase [Comamonadaceae bacterium]
MLAGRARRGRRPTASDGYQLTLHDAVLRAGDAVRRRPRAARGAVPRLRHARQRARRRRAATTAPLMRELLALRHEEARAARPRQLRRRCRWCRRWRDSPGEVHRLPARPGARARGRYAERDLAELREFAARELGLPDLQAWDLRLRRREAASEARYAFSEPGAQAATSPSRACSTACSDIVRDAVRACAIRADSAPVWHDERALLPHRARRRAASAAVLPRPATRAPASSRGAWMDDARARWRAPGRRAADAGGAPGLQLRAAGGRPAGAADARRRASRCSTSSATACTTC